MVFVSGMNLQDMAVAAATVARVPLLFQGPRGIEGWGVLFFSLMAKEDGYPDETF